MFKIEFNKELFDKHIKEIELSIKQLLEHKLKSNLLKYERNCLEYVRNNLKNILQADTNQMKEYINYFKTNFPKTIGLTNQKRKKLEKTL